MKELFDIQPMLAVSDDMVDHHDQADEAADQLNTILHMIYDLAGEDTKTSLFEFWIQTAWQTWHPDPQLVELDETEMLDFVTQLLLTSQDESDSDSDSEQEFE